MDSPLEVSAVKCLLDANPKPYLEHEARSHSEHVMLCVAYMYRWSTRDKQTSTMTNVVDVKWAVSVIKKLRLPPMLLTTPRILHQRQTHWHSTYRAGIASCVKNQTIQNADTLYDNANIDVAISRYYTIYRLNSVVANMSVLFTVGPNCMLAASHAAPGESRWVCRRDRQTDRRTDGRTPDRYITLSARRVQCINCPCSCSRKSW